MSARVYACDTCGFVFTRTGECNQCPDCGKVTIRYANEEEKKEFEFRLKHPEDVDSRFGTCKNDIR